MGKKKTIKIIISIFLFILGTLGSVYISSYLHLFLTKGFEGINVFGASQAIKILILEKKARNIFMILELGTILLSVFYFLMKDSFYESKLIEITPNIKIPVPAGQMQYGSARFMSDEEMDNLFTVCEINLKDDLIEELLEFGTDEFQKIRKVIKKGKEKTTNADEDNHEGKIKKEVLTENDKIEKVYKYRIQEEIELFLENDINSLNYFNNTIEVIDEIICLEKEKKYQIIKQKIDLMPKGDDKDKLTKRLEIFLNSNSTEIEEEIEKINNNYIKEELNKMLTDFYIEFNDKQEEYVKKIELVFKSIEEVAITEETDLNKYMDIAKDLEKKIDKLPGSESKNKLFDKLYDLMDKIITENNKKYEEIEKLLW